MRSLADYYRASVFSALGVYFRVLENDVYDIYWHTMTSYMITYVLKIQFLVSSLS